MLSSSFFFLCVSIRPHIYRIRTQSNVHGGGCAASLAAGHIAASQPYSWPSYTALLGLLLLLFWITHVLSFFPPPFYAYSSFSLFFFCFLAVIQKREEARFSLRYGCVALLQFSIAYTYILSTAKGKSSSSSIKTYRKRETRAVNGRWVTAIGSPPSSHLCAPFERTVRSLGEPKETDF